MQFVFVTGRSVTSLRLQSRDKQLLGFRSVLGIMAQAVVGKPHREPAYSPRSVRSTGSCSSSTHTEQHSKSVAGTCSRDNAKRCSVHLCRDIWLSGTVRGEALPWCAQGLRQALTARARTTCRYARSMRVPEHGFYLRVYPSSETARNLFTFYWAILRPAVSVTIVTAHWRKPRARTLSDRDWSNIFQAISKHGFLPPRI